MPETDMSLVHIWHPKFISGIFQVLWPGLNTFSRPLTFWLCSAQSNPATFIWAWTDFSGHDMPQPTPAHGQHYSVSMFAFTSVAPNRVTMKIAH